MDTLLHFALGNAVLATGLAVLAAAVTRLWRRPALAHSLWLLVLLKLLTPPLWDVRVPWPPAPQPEPEAPPELPQAAPAEAIPLPAPVEVEVAEPEPVAVEPIPVAEPAPGVSGKTIALAAWATGSLAWWALAGLRLRRFRRLLRAARPAPAEVRGQADRLSRRLGLRRCPGVWFVPAAVSPMLFALGRSPRLLVPADLWEQLTSGQRDTLLLHELAHLRRGDHWVRRLELLALGLYWWHPVAWWGHRKLQEAEEQCCDAWVVWALPEAAPDYASALLETVAFLSRARPALPAGASGAGQVPLLKRRLTMILRGTPPRRLSWAGLCAVLGLAAVLLPLAPAGARSDPVAPKPDPTPPEAPKRTEDPNVALSKYLMKTGHPDTANYLKRLVGKPPFHGAESCMSCHSVPHAMDAWTGRAEPWKQSHDEVIRLLDEVRQSQVKLQQAEARLRRALEQMEHKHPLPKARPPLPERKQTWAESLFKERAAALAVSGKDGQLEYNFPFTNNTQFPLHVAGVRTSGGFLTAGVSGKNEIQPGQTGRVSVRIDTSKFAGSKTGTVYVRFDKPAEAEVALRVHVNRPDGTSSTITGTFTEYAGMTIPAARIHEMQKKLEGLQKEVEALRRELRPGRPDKPK